MGVCSCDEFTGDVGIGAPPSTGIRLFVRTPVGTAPVLSVRGTPGGNDPAYLQALAYGAGDAVIDLNVNGGSRAWDLGVDRSDGEKFKINSAGTLGGAGDRLTIDPTTGHVGIGSASPAVRLDALAGAGGTVVQVYNSGTMGGTGYAAQPVLAVSSKSNGAWDPGNAATGAIFVVGRDDSSADVFHLSRTFFTVLGVGKVGINTPTPTEALEVVGNIKLTGQVISGEVASDEVRVQAQTEAITVGGITSNDDAGYLNIVGGPGNWQGGTIRLVGNSYQDHPERQGAVQFHVGKQFPAKYEFWNGADQPTRGVVASIDPAGSLRIGPDNAVKAILTAAGGLRLGDGADPGAGNLSAVGNISAGGTFIAAGRTVADGNGCRYAD